MRGMRNFIFLMEARRSKNENNNKTSPREPGIGWDVANTWGKAMAVIALARRAAASFLKIIFPK